MSIAELAKLSLVSKVAGELDAHLGLSDRTLAEFGASPPPRRAAPPPTT
jgi:hypothetical protein